MARNYHSRKGVHPGTWVLVAIIFLGIYSMNPEPFEKTAQWLVAYAFEIINQGFGSDVESPVQPGGEEYDPSISEKPDGRPDPIDAPESAVE